MFHGCPGIGKTYFCASLVEWIMTHYNTYRAWREEDLLRRLRQIIQDDGGDYALALEYLIDDEFIILDDVGSSIDPKKDNKKSFEWREEILFNFVDYRYRHQKPTVITSNFSTKDFKKLFADRITSRLFASENTQVEIFDAPDKRSLGM